MPFLEELQKRILILDGAMGTMLQKGWSEEQTLRAYIDAGADIITSNSFSANPLTCGEKAASMAFEAAALARMIASDAPRKVYVAGSVSLTGKSLSISSNADDPSIRDVDFGTMQQAFTVQIEALVKGGVDFILLETCFDALNAKAAICAMEQIGCTLPVVISATVSDRSGRTITGQTLEAFYTSVKHCPNLAAFGINCALGAASMTSLDRDIASFSSHPLIFYPNAGIPDEFGRYNDSPETIASVMAGLASEGLVNIIGGCCGTTPEHIACIARSIAALPTSSVRKISLRADLTVSGIEAYSINPERNFTNIGERTNVAGSRKFARLVSEGDFSGALAIASAQIEGGASIIDVNMDDPMLDSAAAMRTFLRCASCDPAVSKAAVMIDSSHWETILEGLRNTQGKSIVNSISLKEGEEEFLRRARIIKGFGAAVVVMAFDEVGQATTFDRKVEICSRSYRLLTEEALFAPRDIIFDCNILSIGTGIAEHSRFGVDFIEAVRWIKANLPGAGTSGGVSNLSFAFRGNNPIREAMHSAFLYHAIKAGLDMAIVNPQMIRIYDDIDPELRKAVEDVIFDSDSEATSRLVALAQSISSQVSSRPGESVPSAKESPADCVERLVSLVVKGSSESLQEFTLECLNKLGSAVDVIGGPLMKGMERVGEMFSDGRMFLPQVVKSAKTMRDAVDILQPYMEKDSPVSHRPKFVIATVQGDVHDIGKNITSIVLQCGGFDVTDLGVMVPSEEIVEKAVQTGADIIGVSGLITPSLQRMEEICRILAERKMTIPLFVGGAAASAIHTAVRLSPLYPYVFYGADASETAVKAKKYISSEEEFVRGEREKLEMLRTLRENPASRKSSPVSVTSSTYSEGGFLDSAPFKDIPLCDVPFARLMEHFDWKLFRAVCSAGEDDSSIREEALEWIRVNRPYARLCARFFACHRTPEDVIEGDGISLPMLREGSSLADFLPAEGNSQMGIFAVTVPSFPQDDSLIPHAVRVCLAEAGSAYMASCFRDLLPQGIKLIMPGIGYACCPDHSLKRDILSLLPKDLGVRLTDSCAMIPEASICGLVIAHRDARYTDVRRISAKQKEAYCSRRGFSGEESSLFLGFLEELS